MLRSACLLLFATVLSTMTYAQQLTGVVTDENTAEPLAFATVFFDNTSYSTETDLTGKFSFSPTNEAMLVVRLVGYQAYALRIQPEKIMRSPLQIKLVAQPVNLKEVQVSTKKDKVWNRQLATFERQFIGESESAEFCKLLNP